ncbi:MAG: polymerase subunit epsilon, partial [Acidimicrobiaceae bacterium]|nr:polymerase subunit epsilon [Acidimicrobiaceae bacterium]
MQRSFDDLGTPLHQVTFVVVDLETTGASPAQSAITEIGAVKLRGGEHLGTLQTLVNPGVAIPPEITYLTGITQAMVVPAPRIEAVLPMFLEFLGNESVVIVGHNVRFDLSFLQSALRVEGYPRLAHRFVDTCALARRLVREEVPNCKLSTLANHFRLATRPTHRALDDAMATGELLHCLLERAGSLGVTALDDLLALPTVKGHPQLAKLRLATALPRRPGVYLFRDGAGRTLYVGKAVDLRRRVRSYFSGEERRKVGQLLREVAAIDHIVTRGELEAAVLEVRLIHELSPRFNRQAKLWRRYAYLKLTLDERFPRLSVVRSPRVGDGCLYLGPLSSAATAHQIAEAIESAVPLRRCRAKPSRTKLRNASCTPAQLGVAVCPCAGQISESDYGQIVATVVRGLTSDPSLLLDPLARKMSALAAADRFEEAASVRDRAAALARALTRQRRLDALRRAGRITVEVPGEGVSVLHDGRLVTEGMLPFDAAPDRSL